MKIVIEFYRIREAEDVRAVVGQETANAADLDDAIEIARQLSQTLDMPQRPDAISISDDDRNELYVHRFDRNENFHERPPGMKDHSNDTDLGRYARAIGVWENEGGAPALDTLHHHLARLSGAIELRTTRSSAYQPVPMNSR